MHRGKNAELSSPSTPSPRPGTARLGDKVCERKNLKVTNFRSRFLRSSFAARANKKKRRHEFATFFLLPKRLEKLKMHNLPRHQSVAGKQDSGKMEHGGNVAEGKIMLLNAPSVVH